MRLLNTVCYKVWSVWLLVLLALAPAIAQNVVCQGEISQLKVEQKPGDTYEWELYDDGTVNFATTRGVSSAAYATLIGANTGPEIKVQWFQTGVYFVKVTAHDARGCTSNLKIGKMKVIPSIPSATLKVTPEEKCDDGSSAKLEVTFSGPGPWNMIVQMNDLGSGRVTSEVYSTVPETDNPKVIGIRPNSTTEYTVIEVSNKYGVQTDLSNTVKLTVHPLPQTTPIYLKQP